MCVFLSNVIVILRHRWKTIFRGKFSLVGPFVVTKKLTRLSFCNYNKRMIIWDETKRKKNLKDHGIDFADVACVFDAPMLNVRHNRRTKSAAFGVSG